MVPCHGQVSESLGHVKGWAGWTGHRSGRILGHRCVLDISKGRDSRAKPFSQWGERLIWLWGDGIHKEGQKWMPWHKGSEVSINVPKHNMTRAEKLWEAGIWRESTGRKEMEPLLKGIAQVSMLWRNVYRCQKLGSLTSLIYPRMRQGGPGSEQRQGPR